ncbi:MAG: DUF928 domain-containing protein [Cyanobacteria bacterium J06600_6]
MFIASPLIFTLKTQANLFGDYVSQETEEVEQRRTVGSGSRSNCQSDVTEKSISLLVPKSEVVHHTSFERPSFFVVANRVAPEKSFKFTLVDPQTATTLAEKTFVVSEGINQIMLPKSTKLQLGKVYLWYVAIPCKNNEDEYREVLGAAVKRSKPSSHAETQLRQAENQAKKAAIYAKHGFWYEALELAIEEKEREQKEERENQTNYLTQLLSSAEITIIHQKSE